MRPESLAAMQSLLSGPLNPSSVHRFGRDAKKHLENARKTIADAVSAWPNEVLFTASGTEANAMALRCTKAAIVMVSAVEHSSVLRARPDAVVLRVDENGLVDLSALDAQLATAPQALVSVMLANNETGVIQPIRDVVEVARKYNALVHCDAVQGMGKIPVDFGALGMDMLTLSAHKAGGPLGAAALVIRRELAITPLLSGGGQELGRRAGTENVAAIAGFAAACDAASLSQQQPLRLWLAGMEAEMEAQGAVIFGKAVQRLPNTSCVSMPGISNEVQLMDFDLRGFAVSAGSACSSGRIEGSHVLAAMGVPKAVATSAIRISAGWATTLQEITAFSEAWKATATRLGRKPAA
jgi:cysteine desulfurase